MGSARKAELLGATVVDWRARHIDDPLTRLRYLRVATEGMMPSGRPGLLRWRFAALLVLAAAAAPYVVTQAVSASRGAPAPARRPQPVQSAGPNPTAQSNGSLPSNGSFPNVWLVEQNAESEEYSNGLQIDCRLAVSNRPRTYAAFDAAHPERGPVGAVAGHGGTSMGGWVTSCFEHSRPARIVVYNTDCVHSLLRLSGHRIRMQVSLHL